MRALLIATVDVISATLNDGSDDVISDRFVPVNAMDQPPQCDQSKLMSVG
jgi:hypothetical protein